MVICELFIRSDSGPRALRRWTFDRKNERKVIKLQLNIGRRTYTTEAARLVNHEIILKEHQTERPIWALSSIYRYNRTYAENFFLL